MFKTYDIEIEGVELDDLDKFRHDLDKAIDMHLPKGKNTGYVVCWKEIK